MTKKVCVFLADGFEEIEGLTVVDLLRRADVEVTTASITEELTIHGAHGIDVHADKLFEEVDYEAQDMAVLPGGMPGTLHLGEHEGVKRVLERFYQEEKYIGMDKRISELKQVAFLEGDFKIDEELSIFTGVTGRKLWPKGNEILKKKCGSEFVQDDFCHEQYLVITEDEKRVLLSGCAHNGILNILEQFEGLFGGIPSHVISGFHMMKKNEYTLEDTKMIEETAHVLGKMDTKFYSGHCTGEYPLGVLKGILKEKIVEMHSGEGIM